MDYLQSLQLFTRIVEQGSFSQAASQLNLPRATATHAIKALEARLGVRLLERTTRHVRTTPDGQNFYQRCVHLLHELDDAEASLHQTSNNLQGLLRIDMHGTHASHIVLPSIGEFRTLHPGIELVISSGDRLVDLVQEGVDCVIRAGTPRDSTLVARPLARMPQVLCASPAYLQRMGTPQHPDELFQHQVVRFFSRTGNLDYPLELLVEGQVRRFPLDGWMSVCDAENYLAAALSGCGLIQLPRFHIEAELQSGQLIELLPDWRSPTMPLSALYPYHRQASLRVKAFIEWVSQLYQARFGPITPD